MIPERLRCQIENISLKLGIFIGEEGKGNPTGCSEKHKNTKGIELENNLTKT